MIFTPAVFLALASLVVLLIGTGDPWIWGWGIAALAFAGLYAAVHRPSLGADLPTSRIRPQDELDPQVSVLGGVPLGAHGLEAGSGCLVPWA
jgi:hypothetical protein